MTATETEMEMETRVWPIVRYRDARAGAAFLQEAFGFELTALYPDEQDAEVVVHGELRWPGGGGVMFGTVGVGSEGFRDLPAGDTAVYVVCDDPDALHDRAVAAGAEVHRALRDEDYGSRDVSFRDPEGNLWSFGTYGGA